MIELGQKDMVTIAGIAGLVTLEGIAMCTGNDGATFMPVVMIISGMVGYKVKEKTTPKPKTYAKKCETK